MLHGRPPWNLLPSQIGLVVETLEELERANGMCLEQDLNSPSVLGVIALQLLKQERLAGRARMAEGGRKRHARGTKSRRKVLTQSGPSEALDRVAYRFNVSGRHLRRIIDIVEAARKYPLIYSHLLPLMDKPRNVSKTHAEFRKIREKFQRLNII